MTTAVDAPVWKQDERRFLVFHAQQVQMMHPLYAATHAADAWQQACRQGFATHDAPYVMVALVLAPTVETVFAITNNGVDPDLDTWTDDARVIHLRDGAERSTSVGDVVMEPATGTVLVCASTGWSRINADGTLGEKLLREEG